MPVVTPLPLSHFCLFKIPSICLFQIPSYINLFVCWSIFSLNLKIPFLHPNLLLVFSEKWKIVVEFCCKKIWNWKQDLSLFGTCWLFGSWMLTSFSFTFALRRRQKVKVPTRLCQMTLKSPDTLLDTNWYFDLDEKWISTANNSYYFLLVTIWV